jgi:hypothetical protein
MNTAMPERWHWHDRFGRKDGVGEPIPFNALREGPKMGNCSPFSYAVSDDNGFVIAHCSGPLITMSSERSEGNARMVAASLQMLKALKIAESFMAGFEDDEMQEGINDKLSMMRAAIAAATGEKPA